MRTFMELDAGLGDEVHLTRNSGEDYVDWIIDVATGDMTEQRGYVLPLKGGKHCLFDDGRIGEAWECGDAPKP